MVNRTVYCFCVHFSFFCLMSFCSQVFVSEGLVHSSGAPVTGTRSPWPQNFVRRSLIFAGLQCGSGFDASFWCVECSGGCSFFLLTKLYIDRTCILLQRHSVMPDWVFVFLHSPVVTTCTAQWSVTICTACLTFSYSTFCPHSVFVFCVDLRTNSDYFTVQHWLVGFYNWDGVCLLCSTFYILRSAHTVYLCVLCGSENKQRLFHSTALTDWLVFKTECLLRGTDWGLHIHTIQINLGVCSLWNLK